MNGTIGFRYQWKCPISQCLLKRMSGRYGVASFLFFNRRQIFFNFLIFWWFIFQPNLTSAKPHSEQSKTLSVPSIEQSHQLVAELMQSESVTLQKQQAMPSAQEGFPTTKDENEGLYAIANQSQLLSSIQLVALYGTGDSVFAQVKHFGQTLTFAPGQQQPLQSVQNNIELKGIHGRCVQLKISHDVVKRCITPSLP